MTNLQISILKFKRKVVNIPQAFQKPYEPANFGLVSIITFIVSVIHKIPEIFWVFLEERLERVQMIVLESHSDRI